MQVCEVSDATSQVSIVIFILVKELSGTLLIVRMEIFVACPLQSSPTTRATSRSLHYYFLYLRWVCFRIYSRCVRQGEVVPVRRVRAPPRGGAFGRRGRIEGLTGQLSFALSHRAQGRLARVACTGTLSVASL